MALIKCTGCGHMISDKATKCPKCGTPLIKDSDYPNTVINEDIDKVEKSNTGVEATSTVEEYTEEPQSRRKTFVALFCGILFFLVAIGAYFFWEQKHGYERLLIDGHPIYSEKLVMYAEKGDSVAQCDLGLCYFYGYGIEQNYHEAFRWCREAAGQGYSRGQLNLGICYFEGCGVEQDINEALLWFKKAAEKGSADAQFCLGQIYEDGNGVSQDFVEAEKWYKKAAGQGLKEAIEKLSAMNAAENSQLSYSGLTFRTFTESEYDESNSVTYQSRLSNTLMAEKLKERGFVLSDTKTESRPDYTGEDFYDVTIETYSKTVNGHVTTVKLESEYTEIHFPNLNDVEEFKKTVRACNLKETKDGFEDSEEVYWAGTDVYIKETIVTLRYRSEP